MKDSNPLALFLLLYLLIPPTEVDVPLVGKLFHLNQARLLSLTVLLPAVISRTENSPGGKRLGLTAGDIFLLAFGALHLALFAPYESITNTLRRAVLYGMDTYVLYFAFSRLGRRPEMSIDALGALALFGVVLAPIGAFESLRQWLLYTGISAAWGMENEFAWLFRGDKLRAQASTGHALGLGWLLAMSTGIWMHLRNYDPSRRRVAATFCTLAAGLLFTYSRAPWVMAALMPVSYLALTGQNILSFLKKLLTMAAAAAVIFATPIGADIADKLPFIGTADQDTVEYRQQLAETSWRLIQEHPWLGNPFVLLEMEELRQGQGIIDLVNGFTTIALYYGLIGLALYVAALLVPSLQCFARMRRARAEGDRDTLLHAAVLLSCMVGTVFFIVTTGGTWFQWGLIGLMTASRRWQSAPIAAPAASEPPRFFQRRSKAHTRSVT